MSNHNKYLIGSTALVQYFGAHDVYVAAGNDDFGASIYARVTSQPKDLGNGRLEATMVHEFLAKDGSSISTTDVLTITPIDNDEARYTVLHTVVNSTGRFEGKRGTFPSVGIHNTKLGRGVQFFSGSIE